MEKLRWFIKKNKDALTILGFVLLTSFSVLGMTLVASKMHDANKLIQDQKNINTGLKKDIVNIKEENRELENQNKDIKEENNQLKKEALLSLNEIKYMLFLLEILQEKDWN